MEEKIERIQNSLAATNAFAEYDIKACIELIEEGNLKEAVERLNITWNVICARINQAQKDLCT